MQYIVVVSFLASLLYSETLSIEGVWNGGGKEIYTYGNETYCFKPTQDSSATFFLETKSKPLESCIYLATDQVIGSICDQDPTLNLSSLSNITYKIVLAPEESVSKEQYIINANYDGLFGRCSDYYQSGYLGMSIEHVNFLLGLAGLFSAVILYGSITYVILTLGNF